MQFPENHNFAQTNIQLINQLRGRYTDSEIDSVRVGYEAACDLFAAKFRDSGKPFLTHLVGTSSILAWLRAPIDTILAGLLHAAYVDGNFGSRIGGHTSGNRERIRRAVGTKSEDIIFAYTSFPWRSSAAIPRLAKRSSKLTSLEKEVLLVRLANELEEYLDLGLLYCADSEQRLGFAKIYGSYMIGLAADLGHEDLAGSLEQAFDFACRANSDVDIPGSNENSCRKDSLPGRPASNTGNPAAKTTLPEKKNGFRQFPEQAIQGTVSLRFEELVSEHPGNAAIDQNGNKLSYVQLSERVDRVANSLLTRFGPGDDPVLTLCGHGANMIVSALAAFKAGKIWVPLDPSHPIGRLSEITKDAGAVGMIADDDHLHTANAVLGSDNALVTLGHALSHSGAAQGFPRTTPESLACVLYTSGSTGTPKGVVHNHRNLLHLALRGTNALFISTRDRLTLLPSCSQIAGVTDFLRALLNGATLLPFDVRQQPIRALSKWLREKSATIYHSSPTFFRLLSETFSEDDFFPEVRIIHLGGEAMKQADVDCFKKHFSKKCLLVNNLGCTELSGYCQFFMDSEYTPARGTVPAGFAAEGVEVSLAPDGADGTSGHHIGEIKVTSPYVALGYWRRPEETEKVFTQHQNGERTYSTGDLGFFREDGCLMYSGRNDRQLIVHGNRVDVAEIESVIETSDLVERVAVKGSRHQGEKLNAYLVAEDPGMISAGQLEEYLRDKLPSFMIPHIVLVEELPLTPNHKVDLEKLDGLAGLHTTVNKACSPPNSPTEKYLAGLWTHLLDIENIGVEHDFFTLGGDSLLAMRLTNHIEDAFSISLGIRDIFEYPTLGRLATLIVARTIQDNYEGLCGSERHLVDAALNEIESLTEDQAHQLIETSALADNTD